MEWILILWINGGNRAAIDHIEFPTKQVCEYAGVRFLEQEQVWGMGYLCVPKTFTQAPPESKGE